MIDLQMKILDFPLLGWICLVFIVLYLGYSYYKLQKNGLEKFGSTCGGAPVTKELKPLIRPKKMIQELTLTCFYANDCYWSKKMMGNKMIPGSVDKDGNPIKGEWDELKDNCAKKGIKCLAKECSNNHLNRSLAAQMGIRGFPTCVLTFKNKIIKELPGARSAKDIMHEISEPHHHEEKSSDDVPNKGFAIKTYYADWCYYSKKLMGIDIVPSAKERDGTPMPGEWKEIESFCKRNKVNCSYVETSKGPGQEESRKLGINGFPTTLIYKDGKKIEEIGGYMKSEDFLNVIKKSMVSN